MGVVLGIVLFLALLIAGPGDLALSILEIDLGLSPPYSNLVLMAILVVLGSRIASQVHLWSRLFSIVLLMGSCFLFELAASLQHDPAARFAGLQAPRA